MKQYLCRLDEIEEPGARGFTLSGDGPALEIFVVRAQGRIFGYVDSCPHIGTPLEFLPDRFLTADRTEILCSTHGARFEIATGRCTAGPCRGRFLTSVPVFSEDGRLFLDR